MASKRTLLLLFLGDPTTDRRVRNFERLFAEAGWSVELLALTPKASRGARRFWEYRRQLARAARDKQVDVVMACDLYGLGAAAWMRKHGRARFAIYDAREVYTELPSVAGKPLAKRIWRSIERRGLVASDLILVTAPHDLQAILDVHSFVPRSLLIRNLPWQDTTLRPDRSLLERFGIPRDAIVFVYIGGLQRGRGLPSFLLAMRGSDIHFLIIGDGALRESLESIAAAEGLSSRVHFAGSMESSTALRLAASCDAGVVLIEPLTKSYELALPSKVFEYMMAGVPVLSSDLRHVTELFGSEPWLATVDVRHPLAIRQGIDRVIQLSRDSQLRHEEQTLALTHYHFEQDARNLLSFLEQKLG